MSTPLTITYQPIEALKPYARNARVHKKAQIQQIADSITTFGFTNPVLVDQHNCIVAGHGRVKAAQLLGMAEVPTIRLEHLTPAQRQAYILADNRLAEKSGWDKDTLAIELQSLMQIDLDFEVSITGFAKPEIDLMIQDLADADPDAGDDIPAPPIKPISQIGDLWQLGDHLLLCGDCLCAENYTRLMSDTKAQVVFTDPPYNVPIQGHVSGLGKVHHEEFAMGSGEMSEAEFTSFLKSMASLLTAHSVDGSIHFICMDWRHIREFTSALQTVYAKLKNVCIWNKDNGGMGALYRSQHEMVFVFKNGTASHINNVELGKHGRYRTNVWNYRSPNGLRRKGKEELQMHPTVKPVRMIADALLDCSHRGGLVLDPFGGSGSTLIAAENTGRHARLMEIDPKYVDVIITRWQEYTGKAAVHVDNGKTFAEVKKEREESHGR